MKSKPKIYLENWRRRRLLKNPQNLDFRFRFENSFEVSVRQKKISKKTLTIILCFDGLEPDTKKINKNNEN
jgi:hypothetical protein